MSQTMKNDPLLLGLVLVIGAVMYSRSTVARAQGARPPGTGSMPGNVGTGTAQMVGGALGSFFGSLFKPGQPLPRWTSYDPTNPDPGVSYDPDNPGAFIPVQDLVRGSVHDYMTGDSSSYDIPTTGDIFDSVVGDSSSYPDTVIRNPGSYW